MEGESKNSGNALTTQSDLQRTNPRGSKDERVEDFTPTQQAILQRVREISAEHIPA
jgi:hypothetical protein